MGLLRTKGLTRLAICLATGRASPPVVGGVAERQGAAAPTLYTRRHITHGPHFAQWGVCFYQFAVSTQPLTRQDPDNTTPTRGSQLRSRPASQHAHGVASGAPGVSRRGRGAGRQAGVREDAARKQERGRGKKTGRRLTLGKLARFGRRRQASVAVWPLRSQVALASHRPPDG